MQTQHILAERRIRRRRRRRRRVVRNIWVRDWIAALAEEVEGLTSSTMSVPPSSRAGGVDFSKLHGCLMGSSRGVSRGSGSSGSCSSGGCRRGGGKGSTCT